MSNIFMGASMTRRGALAAVGAAAIAHAAGIAHGAARPAAGSDAARFMRLRTSPDGRPVMWVYGGILLAKVEGQVARPLVGVGGMSFTRAVERAAGVFDWQLDEVGYYRDLSTGAILETFLNPLTGKTVVPAHYRSPLRLTFTGSAVLPRDPLPPGTEFNGRIERLAEVAGVAAMTEDLYVQVPAQPATDTRPARPARQLASLGTFTAEAAALDSGRRQWIACQLSYATMNSFAPWLGMEGIPGVQNMRLAGRKCRLLERGAIPGWLHERARKDHPQFFEEPGTWR